ncbi:MAG: hypothetical protein ACYS8W_06735 [Planctomycetota bacterium]|jgi:hypothetical protein
MKRFCIILAVILIFGVAFLPRASAKSRKGVVKLRNGAQIFGEILENTEEVVILRFSFGRASYGEMRFDKSYVEKVTYEEEMRDDISIPGGTDMPEFKPKTDPPKTDPPKTDPPKTDPPKTDPPKTDPPKTDPPKKEDPLGEVLAPPGENFTIRPPKNWNVGEKAILLGETDNERKMLVFTGDTVGKVTQRIFVARLPKLPQTMPQTAEVHKKFIVDLMMDFNTYKFIKRIDGPVKVKGQTFGGETYYVEGSVNQVVFRHNFYFAKNNTYMLAIYTSENEYTRLKKLFEEVTKSFKIQE